jgi:hypothetical protein
MGGSQRSEGHGQLTTLAQPQYITSHKHFDVTESKKYENKYGWVKNQVRFSCSAQMDSETQSYDRSFYTTEQY